MSPFSTPVAAATPAAKSASAATRKRENTRERLLEAAVDVFVAKGIKRVTVDDLTKAAGFTRGAFYSNFDSVDEVFFEVFKAKARGLLSGAHLAVDAAETVDLDFVVDLMGTLSDNREWLVLHAEFSLLALRDDEAKELLFAFSHQLRAELAEVITHVLARMGRRPKVSVEQMAQVVVGLQNQLAMAKALGQFGAVVGGDVATDALVRQVLGALLVELSEVAGE